MKKLLLILINTIPFTAIGGVNLEGLASPSENILGEYTLLSQSGGLRHFCGYTAVLKYNKYNQKYIFSHDSGSYSFSTKTGKKTIFKGTDMALNDGRFDGKNEMWYEIEGSTLKSHWNQTQFKLFKRNEITKLDLAKVEQGEIRFSRSADVTFEVDSNYEFDCLYSKTRF